MSCDSVMQSDEYFNQYNSVGGAALQQGLQGAHFLKRLLTWHNQDTLYLTIS